MDLNFWKKDYRLDKMTLGELWIAYFMYLAIQVYIVLGLCFGFLAGKAVYEGETSWWQVALSVVVVIMLYPLIWYLLHRFVLHGSYLYKSPWTARIWKRIHFDHHRDPHDLKVLFGALYTTLPTILFLISPIGYLIGGLPCAFAALSTGLFVTCFYEFCHCIQHLKYTPKSNFLKKMKKLHLQHHFHDENHNYGITNFVPDKLLGTFNHDPRAVKKSPTVFNLGYTGKIVKLFPWVARHTKDISEEDAIEKGIGQRQYWKKDAD